MHLELAPNFELALTRLENYIHTNLALSSTKKVNIVVPTKFQPSTLKYFKNKGTSHYNHIIISEKPKTRLANWTIYFQFDFLNDIVINYNYAYISSLRYPRRIKDVENWFNGKSKDIILSLIAINQNIVTCYSHKVKGFHNLQLDRRDEGVPQFGSSKGLKGLAGYSGYSGYGGYDEESWGITKFNKKTKPSKLKKKKKLNTAIASQMTTTSLDDTF